LAGGNTGLAPLFKLPHVTKAHGLTVYVHVREGTASSIKYIVLCCGRVGCEAQNSRSCQSSEELGLGIHGSLPFFLRARKALLIIGRVAEQKVSTGSAQTAFV
jgi:hypothetical protein